MKPKTKKVLKILAIVIAGIFLISLVKNLYRPVQNKISTKNKTDYAMPKQLSKGMSWDMSSESALSQKSMDETETIRNRSANQPENPANQIQPTEKKIIKNGQLDLKVENIESSYEEIKNIAKNNQGDIFSSNFQERSKGKKIANITIKVPVDNFEKTISQIKKTSTQVLEESTKGRDVTEQYVDLKAQIKNKKAQEEAFVKILERSGEISDVLEVTKEISRVRGEIERLEGRIRYLESQTDMSTINVNLSEDAEITPIKKDWRPIQEVKESASILVKNIQEFVNGLIFFVIVIIPSLIPYLIIFGLIYWLGKKIYKKYLMNKD